MICKGCGWLNFGQIDVSEIYRNDLIDADEVAKMNKNFNKMSVEDILNYYEIKLMEIRQKFNVDTGIVECKVGDDLRQLKEDFKKTPLMGSPMLSPKMNTICHGRRKKALYIFSAATSYGKTRSMLGEACFLSVGHYYDSANHKWIHTGMQESVLFISKELELEECRSCCIATISGVPELVFTSGKYMASDEQRLDKAIEYMEQANLYMVRMPVFDSEDIENIIKVYKQKYNVGYVFFDYIASNPKLMAESIRVAKVGLREDVLLMNLAARLKEMALKLNVHIQAATQITEQGKKTDRDSQELDQMLIRSAKSIADAGDICWICYNIQDKDREVIDQYLEKGFTQEPNVKYSVYKVRRGKYYRITLYLYYDRDIVRFVDCFVTNSKGEIMNIEDTNIEVILDKCEDKELKAQIEAAKKEDNDVDDDGVVTVPFEL